MQTKKNKVGIITYHASYNCGSMLQAYALQLFLKKNGYMPEMIDFVSLGQKRVYNLYSKKKSIKSIIRNSIIFLHESEIIRSNHRYELFKKNFFNLTPYITNNTFEIIDNYDFVIAGADQIWNITIADYDDAYFLPWVTKSKRIAYAPSFGARNIIDYTNDKEKFKGLLNSFDSLSIRENNGQKWIEDLIGEKVPVVLDPTLIIEPEDYEEITSDELNLPEKYIFYYSPSFSLNINKLVNQISKKYGLPVIAFNAKSFYLKGMNFTNFDLPSIQDPTTYLQLIKNATMVITTSFHGSIFSTIFKRNFWIVKNGGMFEDDDRVLTLVKQTSIENRLIPIQFDENFNYMEDMNYEQYDINLKRLKKHSQEFLLNAMDEKYETTK